MCVCVWVFIPLWGPYLGTSTWGPNQVNISDLVSRFRSDMTVNAGVRQVAVMVEVREVVPTLGSG